MTGIVFKELTEEVLERKTRDIRSVYFLRNF